MFWHNTPQLKRKGRDAGNYILIYFSMRIRPMHVPSDILNLFHIKILLYMKSRCGGKAILLQSYLHNWIFDTSKMTSLYWVGPTWHLVWWHKFLIFYSLLYKCLPYPFVCVIVLHNCWCYICAAARGYTKVDFWIGLNDRATNNRFVWADGTESEYRNWQRSQAMHNHRNCILLRGTLWRSARCSRMKHYICERQPQSVGEVNE